MLGLPSAAGVVAAGLDAVALLWALATLLSSSCGEDLAWLGLLAAGGIASTTALAGGAAVAAWWRRSHAPARLTAIRIVLLLGSALSITLALSAVLWFPDGSCPA